MPQQLLSCRFGLPSQTSIPLVCGSLAADDITVTLDSGESITVHMSEVGVDSGDVAKPRAGYAGTGRFSGLLPFKKYSWTATQDGNDITGTFWTAPSDTDDFCMYFATCEHNNGANGSGVWADIKAYIETAGSLPCVGLIHPDDHGYWDDININAGAAYTVTASPKNGKQYDYALAAFACLGLYADSGDGYAAYGYDADRLWGVRNLSLFPQWGDHDTGYNEMGWGLLTTTEVNPSDGGIMQARFEASTSVWDVLMKPLQGEAIDPNNNNAWIGTIGCCEIVAPDGITHGTGDGYSPTNMVGPTTLYGVPQIENILRAVDEAEQPFKLLMMNYGVKHLKAGVTQGILWGAQNPLKDYKLDEYQRFFTESGKTPKSLMDNPKTNGVDGHLVLLHGDVHLPCIMMHKGSISDGNLAEEFCSINASAMNKTGSNVSAELVAGFTYDGSIVEWAEHDYLNSDAVAVRIEVYGSLAQREIHFVYLQGKNGTETVMWRKKLVEKRSGNTMRFVEEDLSQDSSAGSVPSGGGL